MAKEHVDGPIHLRMNPRWCQKCRRETAHLKQTGRDLWMEAQMVKCRECGLITVGSLTPFLDVCAELDVILKETNRQVE